MTTDYQRLLAKLIPEPDGEDFLRLRTAVVDAVNGDGTVDLLLSGQLVEDVPVISGAAVADGDTVQVLSARGVLLVLGTVGTNSWGRVIARGRRTTAKTGVGATETGVIRLDDIPVESGHLYQITCSNANIDITSADATSIGTIRMRYLFGSGTGGQASTSDTQLNTWRQFIDDATNSNIVPWVNNYLAAADGYLSILFSLQRQGSAGTLQWFCSSTDVLDVVVTDLGPAPADSAEIL